MPLPKSFGIARGWALAPGQVNAVIVPPIDPPVPQTPILHDISVNMGQYTPVDKGGVLVGNLPGLVDPSSPPVLFFRTAFVSATSGGTSGQLKGYLAGNTAPAIARTPVPSGGSAAALTTVTLPAVQYVYSVTAVGADAAETTAFVTITTVPNSWNVGDNIGDGSFGNPDAWVTLSAQLGGTKSQGKDILISSGVNYSAQYLEPQGFKPTAFIELRYADPAKPSPMLGVALRSCNYIRVRGLQWSGTPTNHRMFINEFGGTNPDHCEFVECQTVNVTIANQVASLSGAFVRNATNFKIADNLMLWTAHGISVSNCSGGQITGNTVRYFGNDPIAMGGASNSDILIANNNFIAPKRLRIPSNQDHIDVWQVLNDATPTIATNIGFVNTLMIQADGDAAIKGIFAGDPAQLINCRVEGYAMISRSLVGIDLFNTTGIDIKYLTLVMTASGLVSNIQPTDPDVFSNAPIFVRERTGGTGGGHSGGTISDMFSVGTLETHGGWVQGANIVTLNHTYSVSQPTGIDQPQVPGPGPNVSAYFADANQWDTMNSADYVNMTAAQIVAFAKQACLPLSGSLGAFTNSGGTSTWRGVP